MQLTDLKIAYAASLIQRRELSPRDLVKACLDRINTLDPQLNAFITQTADTALQEAASAEKAIGQGEYRGTLHGIPIALKDLYETKGVVTTAGDHCQ